MNRPTARPPTDAAVELLEDVRTALERRRRAELDLAHAVRRAYHLGVPASSVADVLGVTPPRVRQIAGARMRLVESDG